MNDIWNDPSTNEDEYNYYWAWYDDLPVKDKIQMKHSSWQKIFDLEEIDSPWRQNGRYIQATFWELRADMIKSIWISEPLELRTLKIVNSFQQRWNNKNPLIYKTDFVCG